MELEKTIIETITLQLQSGLERSMLKSNTKNYPNQPTLAVGAVVFKDNKVLLVKRGQSPAKGMWAIPGGSVELGETLKQAAEREILEETGLVIKAGEPIFSFEVIRYDGRDRVKFHYYIVDLEGEYVHGNIQPGDDAIKVRWISEEDLNSIEVNPKTRELLNTKYNFG